LDEKELPALLTSSQSIYHYAFGWFGGSVAGSLRQLAGQSGYPLPPAMSHLEGEFAGIARRARTQIKENLEYLTL
jgi:hypothetical protein